MPRTSKTLALAGTLGGPILPPWPQQLHGEVTTSPKASSDQARAIICAQSCWRARGQGELGWGGAGAVGFEPFGRFFPRCRRSGCSAAARLG